MKTRGKVRGRSRGRDGGGERATEGQRTPRRWTGARVYILYFHPRVVVVGAVVPSCRRGRKVTRAKARESTAENGTTVDARTRARADGERRGSSEEGAVKNGFRRYVARARAFVPGTSPTAREVAGAADAARFGFEPLRDGAAKASPTPRSGGRARAARRLYPRIAWARSCARSARTCARRRRTS